MAEAAGRGQSKQGTAVAAAEAKQAAARIGHVMAATTSKGGKRGLWRLRGGAMVGGEGEVAGWYTGRRHGACLPPRAEAALGFARRRR